MPAYRPNAGATEQLSGHVNVAVTLSNSAGMPCIVTVGPSDTEQLLRAWMPS